MDNTSSCCRSDGTDEHNGSHDAGGTGEGDFSGDGVIDCARDGTADEILDTAWDKAENDDTNVKRNVDQWWEGVMNAYWVSRVWPFIACLC
jgi:hypothetical protein